MAGPVSRIAGAVAILSATLGFAYAQAPMQIPADQPARIGAFVFPIEFAGARRTSVREYEKSNPGLGHSVGYQLGPITTTIYVYDLGEKTIPDDPDDDRILAELRSSLKEVIQFRKNAEVKKGFSLPDEKMTSRLNCAWLTFDSKMDGTICIGSAKNKFIKFRTSAPETQRSLGESILFVRRWLPFFWPAS